MGVPETAFWLGGLPKLVGQRLQDLTGRGHWMGKSARQRNRDMRERRRKAGYIRPTLYVFEGAVEEAKRAVDLINEQYAQIHGLNNTYRNSKNDHDLST